MTEYTCRVHPAIGIARVGNSKEGYYIGPETEAGLPIPGDSTNKTGGLPIKPGEESKTITSSDLRDKEGAFKRQAARFRIFQYPQEAPESYPNGKGTEVKIGSSVNGKTVTDIIWTVHLANKKANCYVLVEPPPGIGGIEGYEGGHLPPLRNLAEGHDPTNTRRIRKLTIDPGPRAIRGSDNNTQGFDKTTVASFWESGNKIKELTNYPKSFPSDGFSNLYTPTGDIDTLGELQTDSQGRLLVFGGYGRACAWYPNPTLFPKNAWPLVDDVNNDGWFDDTSDGPVWATLVFKDGSVQIVHGGWVVATDPAYAPQTLNVVSLWDDIYDSWIRKLGLQPEIYGSGFENTYQPSFPDQLHPIFSAAGLQTWNTNLPGYATTAHASVARITATDVPADTPLVGLSVIRNPNNAGQSSDKTLMPLALGDANKSFLSMTLTQYFFLEQWIKGIGNFSPDPGPKLGPGEYLDKAVLVNCLGGRFSPGIDMTFIVRQPELYVQDWQQSGTGPFRINAKPLDYNLAQSSQPFLTEGYVPLHTGKQGLEPGDTSKFMAVPWHTDYNSCAIHTTSPPTDSTLYWSWPAQRPVAVYVATEVINGKLGPQRYSVRGKGTLSDNPANQGRYQDNINIVKNWHQIGVVIQGSAIDGTINYKGDQYLEVESQLGVGDFAVPAFPQFALPPWPPKASPD